MRYYRRNTTAVARNTTFTEPCTPGCGGSFTQYIPVTVSYGVTVDDGSCGSCGCENGTGTDESYNIANTRCY